MFAELFTCIKRTVRAGWHQLQQKGGFRILRECRSVRWVSHEVRCAYAANRTWRDRTFGVLRTSGD
jgi:hypothetical protein